MSSDDSSSRSGLFIYLSTIPRKRFAFVSSAGHAIFPDHALERPLECRPALADMAGGCCLMGEKPYFATAAGAPLAVLALGQTLVPASMM
jgi:hypothetical protein